MGQYILWFKRLGWYFSSSLAEIPSAFRKSSASISNFLKSFFSRTRELIHNQRATRPVDSELFSHCVKKQFGKCSSQRKIYSFMLVFLTIKHVFKLPLQLICSFASVHVKIFISRLNASCRLTSFVLRTNFTYGSFHGLCINASKFLNCVWRIHVDFN